MSKIQSRNISIDILKILSMVMVIILHTKTYGLKGVNLTPSDGLYWIVWTLQFLSIVAVNCFVLISGYFTSASIPSPKKLFKLWLQVEIFSVGIYLILCTIPDSGVEFGFAQLLAHILPVICDRYWFFTCYIILMILAPLLNRFIDTMAQKEFKRCVLTLLSLFVLLPSINLYSNSFGTSKGYSVIWFIILYFVAAYLRRYPLPQKPYGVFYLAITVISIFANTILEKLSNTLDLFEKAREILSMYNGITVFVASVCLFLFFTHHPIQSEKTSAKLFTRIVAASFSVYLIHDHPAIRNVLWNDLIKLYEVTDSIPQYLLRLFITVFSIFVIGIIVGMVLNILIYNTEKLIKKIKRK